ncbi:MAG TPA: GGDEF domain-containing protein [Aquabacterium sp.]|uniref:GGDEF domain-containing protein n=1 Tax=Aquabacterium sp. TaxID=1872578 RepID=UPI002E3815D9|nr:GGDEF domain-containing protein [Aquabacterium sp.]HEX5373076.1 GGDEF domain-containing protein [Aquabacterium sp.]
MRQVIERLLIESHATGRCLLAIAIVQPFLWAYLLTHAWALGSPEVRAGLHVEVVWALQAVLLGAEALLLGTAAWLWPQRQSTARRPGVEFLVALVIGVVYTAIPIAAGIFTAGPMMALLGVVVVGMLLFEWRVMLTVILLCGSALLAYFVAMLAGALPYAMAITPQAFDQGHARWWWAHWQSMVLYVGTPSVLLIVMLLFARHDALHRRLRQLSITDGLTRLSNRRHFMDRLQEELLRQRHSRQPLSVVLIDADHFKHINDRYGHAMGDQVLTTLAGVLTQCLRVPGDLVARLGGEEFGVLLPDTSLAEAEAVCRRLQQQLKDARFSSAGASLIVTVSMGAVQCLGVDAQALLRQADANLYRAKAAGRDRTESSVLEAPIGEEALA